MCKCNGRQALRAHQELPPDQVTRVLGVRYGEHDSVDSDAQVGVDRSCTSLNASLHNCKVSADKASLQLESIDENTLTRSTRRC